MGHRIHPLDESTRGGKVRSASMRKLGKDGTSWTPTEARKRDQMLKQFTRLETWQINSKEYQEGYERIDWGKDIACETCGHGSRCHPGGRCFMKGCECWERMRER